MNNAVRSFLSATDSKGVAACKGMGKTFLLKAKRLQLQEENNSLFLLPKNRLVDVPGTIIIDKMHRKFLSAYDNWINLWLGCKLLYFYIFVVIGRIFLYNSIRANGRIPRMCSKFIKKGTEWHF